MKFYIGIVSLIIILYFTACKNKLNINAPYKEFPSIYAVLNPQEPIQIIRVNKVFLGEGDANDMAKVADSVNYQPGDLQITLERYKNGILDSACKNSASKTLTFHDSLITTNPGTFNTNQRVYVCNDKLFNSGEYHLTIKNLKTNNSFTSKANPVDVVRQDQSTSYTPNFYPAPTCNTYPNCPDYIDYSKTGVLTFTYKIPDFFTSKLIKINQVKMRLHFYDSLFDNSKIYRYVDYPFSNQLSKNAPTNASNVNYNGRLDLQFRSSELFSGFGIELAKMGLTNNIYGRRVYKIEYFIYCSTQEYADYLEYTAPSLSLAQQKPLYSNFYNGDALGIFTFRSTTNFSKETANEFENEFAYNKNTCGYKFFVYNNPTWSTPTCP
ncbi:MAG: hypothetical protein SFY56_13345 [Bacteroidota bacterium]|nr:hypothetical protein [Bacteroidota bacterium]